MIMKSCHPANPWGCRDLFTGVGYHAHNLEGYMYVPSPESLVLPSKPPSMEQTAEDSLFVLYTSTLTILVNDCNGYITSGSFSIPASQLKEHEALARKMQWL